MSKNSATMAVFGQESVDHHSRLTLERRMPCFLTNKERLSKLLLARKHAPFSFPIFIPKADVWGSRKSLGVGLELGEARESDAVNIIIQHKLDRKQASCCSCHGLQLQISFLSDSPQQPNYPLAERRKKTRVRAQFQETGSTLSICLIFCAAPKRK